MSRILLFFFLTFSLFSPKAFAQADYRPGYVIKAPGDTLQGLIKYREGKRSHLVCVFKSNKEASPQKFSPADILGYGIRNDKLFESRRIEAGPQDTSHVFLEVLARGKMTLYKSPRLYMLEKDGQKLWPLLVQKEEVYSNNRRYISASRIHLDILSALTSDCPGLEMDVEKLRLNQHDLVQFVNSYNRCLTPTESHVYKTLKPWSKIRVGAIAGIHFASVDFTSRLSRSEDQHLTDAAFDKARNLVAGFYLNISAPRLNERLSLQIEPILSNERHTGYSEVKNNPGSSQNDITIYMEKLALRSMALYTLTGTWGEPFIGVGATNNIILGSDVTRIEARERYGVITMNEHEAFSLEKQYFSLAGAVGGSYYASQKLRLSLQLSYERSARIHKNNNNLTSTIDGFAVKVGFGL